jgi:hypothetical protein
MVKTALSNQPTVQEACKELANGLGTQETGVILYFASPVYPAQALAAAMQQTFPAAKVFGCTTSGELITGKMTKKSVVAMSLPSDVVEDVCIQVIDDIQATDKLGQAFKHFEKHYGQPLSEFDLSKYVGIVLMDGLSGAEEKVMDKIGDLTDLTFVGGSAGDDLAFKETFVFAHGKAYPHAAILALVKTHNGFDTLKTQSFSESPVKLVATDVDEAARTVNAFNGKPALQAYAEAVATPLKDAETQFMSSPVGLMVGDEPYVRSPQRTQGDSIVFFCNIKQGMELSVLKSKDIVADTRAALAEKLKGSGPAAAIINFNCILRTLELEKLAKTEAYGQVFVGTPTVGFSTYGEAYIGHINQTAVMLLLK